MKKGEGDEKRMRVGETREKAEAKKERRRRK